MVRTALLALFLLAPLAASADEAKPSALIGAIVPAEPEARACFVRQYTQDHLKAHPAQTVAAMEFRLTWHVFAVEEGAEPFSDYQFHLGVRKRGAKKELTAGGPCMEQGGKIFCGVECDGGGVFVTKREDGSLTVSFDDMWGIRMSDSCGEEEASEETGVEFKPGKDDKVFRLDPVPASQCPAFETW